MDKKEKRKVITDIIVIAIFVLLCGLSAGYFVYVAGNGADLGKAFSMSSGGMFYTFFQALGFQVQTIGQDVAVAVGVFAITPQRFGTVANASAAGKRINPNTA